MRSRVLGAPLALAVLLAAAAASAAGRADQPSSRAGAERADAPSGRRLAPAPPSDASPGAASPPAVSEPAVTREEAEAVLAAMVTAWQREDDAGLATLLDEPIRWKAVRDARRLFMDRNYFQLATRVTDAQPLADGGMRLSVVLDLTSKAVTEPWTRREKSRWTYDFARRPGAGVVIAAQLIAEAGLLTASPPWLVERWRGEVRLDRVATDGLVDVRVTATLRNGSDAAADIVGFALHPFTTGLVARANGAALAATVTEASLDAWRVELATAVSPGEAVDVEFAYALSQMAPSPACEIGPDRVRLMAASAWLPLIQPVRPEALPAMAHDLTVIAPAGLLASMPGTLGRAPVEPGPGLEATRFVSELPGVEIPLIALRGQRDTVQLGASLALDILRLRSDPELPATAVSHVTTLAAFLEDHLGPCPVTRLALVESGSDMREAPGWMALPMLAIPPDDVDHREGEQAFHFLGMSMGRLWVVHARAMSGPGARNLAAGLVDHLAGGWASAAVAPYIAARQRDAILTPAQSAPHLDRPLLPPVEVTDSPAIFMQGKARMVFDMAEQLLGPATLRDALRAWWGSTGRGAPASELVRHLGGTPERGAFVAAFFGRQGAAQLSVHDVRVRALDETEVAATGLDPAAWRAVEVEVDNAGLGPVAVDVQVEVDQAVRRERLIVPEYGRAVLVLHAHGLPARVRLDPHRVVWQARSDDDGWPARSKRKRDIFDGERLGDAGSARGDLERQRTRR